MTIYRYQIGKPILKIIFSNFSFLLTRCFLSSCYPRSSHEYSAKIRAELFSPGLVPRSVVRTPGSSPVLQRRPRCLLSTLAPPIDSPAAPTPLYLPPSRRQCCCSRFLRSFLRNERSNDQCFIRDYITK